MSFVGMMGFLILSVLEHADTKNEVVNLKRS